MPPVRGDGFAYELPVGWVRAAHSLTPSLRNPVEILAAGTVRDMRAAAGECAHMPVGALERMTSRDAFVSVMERYGEMPAPPRPAHFTLPAPDPHSDAALCARGEPPIDVYWFDFTEARRGFYVLVALGRNAGRERRDEALSLLDSLSFEPGPEGVHLDPDRTISMRDLESGLSWQLPSPPWRRYDAPLTSLRNERLALGTFGLEPVPRGSECPRAAVERMPSDGALMYLIEYVVDQAESWRSRVPELLRIPERSGELDFERDADDPCGGWIARWRDRGRVYQAHAVFGAGASEELRDEARSILNSIRPD